MLSPGARLGRYEIASPLGAGGMGEVYRARDTELGREVALKVLPDEVAADPDRLKRFEREARALAALSHPNVLTVFDVGHQDERTYLVSERLEGETFEARLRAGRLPPREALDCAARVARGLAAAHAQGIVHRDLKPQNLFLTSSGVVKILDFGLARFDSSGDISQGETESGLTQPGTILGTLSYMSPEQAKGHAGDARSDIFSLGTVLFEMLSGQHPFRRDSAVETLSAILRDDPPGLRGLDVPSPVERLVRQCLEKRPENRFQTANDLALALEALARGEQGTRRSWLRQLGPQIVIGLGVVTAAAALGYLTLRTPAPRITAIRSLIRLPTWILGLETDGTNVYFVQWIQNALNRLMVMPLAGGEVREIPLPWQTGGLSLLSLRAAPPALLLGWNGELWRLPLPSGAPSRIAAIERALGGAAWSRRGDRLAYVDCGETSDALVVADSDGQSPRHLIEVPKKTGGEIVLRLVGWGPSDARLRFTRSDAPGRLFDVPANGEAATEALVAPLQAEAGNPLDWTPNGRYFLIGSSRGLAAHPERPPLWPWAPRAEAQVAGPTHVSNLRFVPDGRRLVVFVQRLLTEVVRLDRKAGVVTPLLGGALTGVLDFSPDGSRLAWVSLEPVGHLWLGRPDGTNRVQLSELEVEPSSPVRWSPDGRRIAFSEWDGARIRIHISRVDEGGAELLAPDESSPYPSDPCWSPDGTWLSYGVGPGPSDADIYLRRVDLTTHAVTKLAGSEGLWAPKCSRAGQILASDSFALRGATSEAVGARTFFKLRDPATGVWTAFSVAADGLNYPTWSRDGRYVYATAQRPRAVVRFEVATGQLETVFNIEGLGTSVWMDLDASDTPLVHRDASQREIFVMDWETR